ncbi:MAG TPA: Na-K-Cl cotransporter [Planctomycetes bacterium]|nr:Na-K-Cl cotransporter [Planctomycetota bacterium]
MNGDAPAEAGAQIKFGTLVGVFVPTVLTILGAIMYLRLGWTVGNAGLLGALLIVILAHVITVTTGLAVSSISTNIRVGAGGAFAIIAQSLGLEAGGSIGVPLYLAQTVSTALYLLAFAEGWQRIYPEHSLALVSLVGFVILAIVTLISTRAAARAQILILGVVAFSLVSIGLGCLPDAAGAGGLSHTPQLWGRFESASFWETFAVFFPAVTGIMAGISLSGNLEDPRRSIPIGTLSAIAVTLVIYLLLAYWLSRVATPEELQGNMTVMVDRARWDWAVLAGLLGATFSSALGSVVAAPRVVQALATNELLPFSDYLAKEDRQGEPRGAMLITALVAFGTLVIALIGGGLNFVAPLITMFFLLTYAMLNLVVLVEQTLEMVSFRPTFRIPRLVPLVGLLSCVGVMFFVNPAFSLVSVVLSLLIYGFLLRRKLPTTGTGDVRSGLFLSMARWAAEQVDRIPAAPERTWSPSVVVPVATSGELSGCYRLPRAMTGRRGAVRALGVYPPGERKDVTRIPPILRDLRSDGVFARHTLLEHEDFFAGTQIAVRLLRSVLFRPNLFFLRLLPGRDLGAVSEQLAFARSQRMGIVLYASDPVYELASERRINVWVREQGPDWELSLRLGNLDLAILLAYEIASAWGGRFLLCMAVHDEATRIRAEAYLSELLVRSRLGRWGDHQVVSKPFTQALDEAPQADLSILGLPAEPDLEATYALTERIAGSCILVRSSGDESVLA